MELKIAIKTSHKFRETRMKPQREIWADEALWFSDERADDVVFVSDNDTYSSNVEKGLFILDYFKDKEFDWLVIACDDTFLNIPNIEKQLQEFGKTELQLIGNRVNYWMQDPTLTYVSGMCIMINRPTLLELMKYLGNPVSTWDDVDIGILARKAGIKVTHVSGIYPFGVPRDQIESALAIHKYYVV